jgi:aryl-alcohol dehydrogenase-like predicted oxidoreductase
MDQQSDQSISRRQFIQSSAVAAVGLSLAPNIVIGKSKGSQELMKRSLGLMNFDATTLGLGGQGALEQTPLGQDPVKIILKAFEVGVNYFDTSNAYGRSQLMYGKAFQAMNLIPGQHNYNEKLRRSIFLTSKTMLRWAKGGWEREGIGNWTEGNYGSKAIDDVKRTLKQVFGDGNSYPAGAYLDMVLMHNVTKMVEVDALYEGIDNLTPNRDHIGTLAALVDYRDGTNFTGLNPKEEKLIRHIGFSAHENPAVAMEMLQRDTRNNFDGMLIALNANDRLNFNMQYNPIPIAAAKNMGIIAMKIFADGAMYTKESKWMWSPDKIIKTIGSPALPSRDLIQYPLTTPGIHTAIIGIGNINDNPDECQLVQNMAAAQIAPDGLTKEQRLNIEKMAAKVKDGKTNYYQLPMAADVKDGKINGYELPKPSLSAPRIPLIDHMVRNDQRFVSLRWQTAYAGDEPIKAYEIWRDNQKIADVPHKPQITKVPFVFEEKIKDKSAHTYKIVTVDAVNRNAATKDLIVELV